MFNLRDFIKIGLLDAVGKLADYQVILNAAGWHEKGVLTTDDLADIHMAITEKNVPKEPEEPVEPEESIETEVLEEEDITQEE